MPEQHKKQRTDETRSLICRKYESGKTPKEISVTLELGYRAVLNVIKIFRDEGRVNEIKKRSPKEKKITDAGNEFRISEITSDASSSLKYLQRRISESMGITASLSTIDRAFSNFNFSFKRIQFIPVARNTDSNIEVRRVYANFYLLQDEEKIVFADEMGVNCSMRIVSGSLIGTTTRKTMRAIRSKNYSVSAALTKNKVIFYKKIGQSYNGERYADFIRELIEKLREENMNNMLIVLDNCSIHKVAEVRELILQSQHRIQFLPPYSPQLNPIEEAFSKWKNCIKREILTNVDELHQAVLQGNISITQEDCVGYFDHVREFALKALMRETF